MNRLQRRAHRRRAGSSRPLLDGEGYMHTWIPTTWEHVPPDLAQKHPDCAHWLVGYSRHPHSPAVLASMYVPLLNGATHQDVIREWGPTLADEAEAAARSLGLDW